MKEESVRIRRKNLPEGRQINPAPGIATLCVSLPSFSCFCPANSFHWLGTVEPPLDVNKNGNLAGYGNHRNRRFDNTDEHEVSAADDQSNLRSPPGESASGAVYVRWGHHSCPSSSELVYTGSAAGTSWVIPGAELISFAYRKTPFCLAPARVAKLVIPGTNVCPSNGWTREYGGYLMSNRVHSLHRRSMHVCVDREMQVIPRTDGPPSDGKRDCLDLVETRCSPSGGGIPCGPYVDGYELTCAVCTK
ncbi:putative short-chain collagen C4 [Apostichopus japonicus]|uniref:Putative short-chain collagen C4 n=1 Tax=Stichopus japonicus TaxID=307972 RepID=A0A2G8JZ97_STIJA|nr:putative short-chain collagen C4 [Apostichopus japonicus]